MIYQRQRIVNDVLIAIDQECCYAAAPQGQSPDGDRYAAAGIQPQAAGTITNPVAGAMTSPATCANVAPCAPHDVAGCAACVANVAPCAPHDVATCAAACVADVAPCAACDGGGVVGLSVADIAASKIEDAARMVLMTAHAEDIDTAQHLHGTLSADAAGNWQLILPDDYLRLIAVQLSDWQRAVYNAITPSHPRYKYLYSPVSGLRGTPSRPAASVQRLHGGLTLTLYGSRMAKPTLTQGLIVTVPRFDRNGGINLPECLYRAVVYQAAALTLSASGQGDFAGLMSNLAQQAAV